MSIRILLADDHKIFRDGLRPLLDAEKDLEVVGEAEDGLQVIERARDLAPDVVIMDISMPRLNGVDTARRLSGEPGAPKIVALSMHSDRRFVIGMLKAGASAYLLKDCAFDDLAGVVRDVTRGEIRLSPQIRDQVIDDYLRLIQSDDAPADPLTQREREVLQLLAEGNTTQAIADALSLSPKTVETHRKKLMDKLGLHSVAELTKYAIRQGLTGLD